jgi:hypothetical protein
VGIMTSKIPNNNNNIGSLRGALDAQIWYNRLDLGAVGPYIWGFVWVFGRVYLFCEIFKKKIC